MTTPQLTDEQIDAVCAPGRAERWKGDGRQYDRDTARLIERAILAAGPGDAVEKAISRVANKMRGTPQAHMAANVIAELRAELAAQGQDAAPAEQMQEFWLWKNFVDGRPEYWAFDNPYPINLTDGDPQTLGEPCGYAIFKPSRNGRPDVPRAQVIAAIKRAKE